MSTLYSFEELLEFTNEKCNKKNFKRIDNNEFLGKLSSIYPKNETSTFETRINDGMIEFILEIKEKEYCRITKYYGIDFYNKSVKVFKEID